MSQRSPKVSIGIPVRNGEKYLRFAIDSLLASHERSGSRGMRQLLVR